MTGGPMGPLGPPKWRAWVIRAVIPNSIHQDTVNLFHEVYFLPLNKDLLIIFNVIDLLVLLF